MKSFLTRSSFGHKKGRSQSRPCLKSLLRFRPQIDRLEDRTLPSVTLGVHVAGINGANSSCGCLPPDGAEAIGPLNAMEGVNTAMETTDRSGNVLSGPTALSSFFSGHGFTVHSLSDPVIYFDESVVNTSGPNGRFIVLILDFTSTSSPDNLDIAISVDADATHGFTNFRQINVGEGSFFADQPRLGINADAYFVQFNMFSTVFGTYDHPQVMAIQKSTFLSGGLTTFHHDMSNSLFSIDPANMHGAAAGGPEYFVTEDGTTVGNIDVITETNVLSNTPTDTTTVLTAATYSQPPAAPQPSGTVTTNDSRMLTAAWRNNILVSTQTVGTGSPTEAHARWYQISTSGTPSLTQFGEINPGSGIATYFPSIDIDTNNDIGMTYIESSSSEFVSMYVTGRTPSDPSGTMETGVRAMAGTTNYTGSRMGDYSGTGVDPVTGTTFWSENEFINNGSAGNWATAIASFTVATANKVNTTTAVTSSVNPSVFGQSVTFTATVTPASGSNIPTGIVTFLDGTATLGTATLSGGSGTLSTSALAVGNHNITASYGGDSNFNGSTSNAITQTVNKANTTTALTTSVNPSVFGQAVNFTATVSASAPGSGTPTGTVTFLDGGTSIGSGTLSGGSASFSTSALAVGTHSITASYGGSGSFNSSTSGAVNQTVNQDGTSTTVASSVNPSSSGQTVTFTATVSASAPGSGTPTGTVTFLDGGASIGSGTLSGGQATFSTSGLATGTHAITASYGGDGNFSSSTSAAITQTVNAAKVASTTTVVSSVNPSVFGQAVTFTATVTGTGGTPTGTVTFLDGTATLGTATLSAGSGTLTTSALAVGNHNITASYSGDSNFNSSTSNPITQTVNKANTTTALTTSVNPSVFGQTVNFAATVSASAPGSGTPTGTVTFLDGGTSIGSGTLSGGTASFSTSALAVATHSITASYGGDGNFNGSTSGAVNQTVNQDGTTTTVASSVNPSSSGQSVTFTATVTANSPGSGTPTGTVTFLDGGASIGSGTLSGGTATFSTSALSVGNHAISASYGGDANFTGSTSSAITQTVNAAAATHYSVSAPSSSTAGSAFTITVTVLDSSNAVVTSYTGTVHFTSSDSQAGLPADYTFTATDAGVHTFTGGVTLKTAGSQSVTATDTVTSSITGSATVSVSPAAASKLVFGQQPTNTRVNAIITPPVTVLVQDAFGNTVTSATNVVNIAIGTNPSGGTLSGTTSVTVSGGIATFSNLSINKVGNGYTLVATSGTLTSATSASFNIRRKGGAVAQKPGPSPIPLAAALAYETKLQRAGLQTNAFGGDDGGSGGSMTSTGALTSSGIDQFFAAKSSGSNSLGKLDIARSADQLVKVLGTL
jgi:hypothetical protein